VAATQGPVPTIITLFRRTSAAMVTDLVSRLAAAGYRGLNESYHVVFENIDPGGTRLTELAARAGMTHPSMSELVSTLEQRGYVTRVPDPTDGRARLVRLTPLGKKLARTAIREIAAIRADWEQRVAAAGLRGDLAAALEAALDGQSIATSSPFETSTFVAAPSER
jgi:DNA-binding MarR family transcriptional regulator